MITDKEIETKASEFGIRPIDVEKDYVYSWLLKGLFLRPAFAEQLVLKGGNALRKGYLPNSRFSKDLDFSAHQGFKQDALEKELKEVCAYVAAQTGITFLDKMTIKEKDLPIPGVDALEARLYFRGFYGEENLNLRTQLDITQFDKIYLPVQTRPLLHPYSDSDACSVTIKCQKLEEILASKLTTLLHRRKPVDLFDLLYSIVFRDQYGVVRREVITTFLKKSIFEPNPIAAKEQLLAVPIGDFKSLWTSIIAPADSLFDFEFVTNNFAGLVESLFSLVVPAQSIGRTAFGGGRPFSSGRGLSSFASNYFASNLRSTIINAGRSRTMVDMVYDGYRRLVEPYKLEYYVRKKDNQGLEYFWGYDTTGGKSGKASMKQFICDKIESVHETLHSFTPRYEVEL